MKNLIVICTLFSAMMSWSVVGHAQKGDPKEVCNKGNYGDTRAAGIAEPVCRGQKTSGIESGIWKAVKDSKKSSVGSTTGVSGTGGSYQSITGNTYSGSTTGGTGSESFSQSKTGNSSSTTSSTGSTGTGSSSQSQTGNSSSTASSSGSNSCTTCTDRAKALQNRK